MSQDVTDIRGERADFASGGRGGVIFIGLFSKEKDLWLFGRAPSASQKALPRAGNVHDRLVTLLWRGAVV